MTFPFYEQWRSINKTSKRGESLQLREQSWILTKFPFNLEANSRTFLRCKIKVFFKKKIKSIHNLETKN